MILGSGLAGTAVAIGSNRILPAWDIVSRRRISSLMRMVEALSIPDAAITAGLHAWGVLLIAIPVLIGPVLGMYILIVPMLMLLYQSPKWILSWVISTRATMIRDQMVPLCLALANTARSGMSLPRGLEEVARDSPWPIHDEVQRIVNEFRRGRTIAEAVRDAQQRLQLDTFNVFAGVVLICYESGAKYTEALEKVGHSLQENQRLERQLNSETAGGRTVILVLGGFPFAFLLMFYFLDAESTGMVFSTVFGQIILAAVGFLTYLSVKLAQQILAIEA
jgi:Flp pilus assembly protein TadB